MSTSGPDSPPRNGILLPPRSGLLLIDKPGGMTSHDVVSRTRRVMGTRKVGHAGTLDPMATGLLVLGVGSSTRLLTYLVGLDKEYRATIRLGRSTTTDDADGDVVAVADASGLDEKAVREAAAAFIGEISQVPSSYSAIKVGGKKSYELARAGQEVALAARSVTIATLDVGEVRAGAATVDLDVRVECSSGTYIRAIARDLGERLAVGGHLAVLRRTRIGPFRLEDAAMLDGLEPSALRAPSDIARELFPVIGLDLAQATDLAHGKRIELTGPLSGPSAGPVAAVSADGRLVGLVSIESGTARVLVNFPPDGVPA